VQAFVFELYAQQGPVPSPPSSNYIKYQEAKVSGTLKTTTDEGFGLGEIPSPVQRNFSNYVSTKAAVGDAVYDLRTAGPGGTSLLTTVKNQGSCGSCWTFAAMGATESRWKILGHGTNDLSEDNMNNCHEFVPAACEGGNLDMATSYFVRKSGPYTEADDPYSVTPNSCPAGLNEAAYIPNVRFLPRDNNTLKQALIDYGALYTNMYWADGSYNSSNKTYYYSGTSGTNHAVLLVGWDNNKATAGGTGAWIIKNSWGDGWGENGFFYISYNDTRVNTTPGYFLDRTAFDAKAKLYSYSRLGAVSGTTVGSSVGYGLIKYVATGNQQLTKVGTWINDAGAILDITVYDNFVSSTLSGQLASITNQTCNLPGYYTYNLSSPVSIANGNDFYILIKYNVSGATYPIPIEMAYSGYAAPTIESNKCWLSTNGTSNWTLIGSSTSYAWDLCINAYTVEGPLNPENFTASTASGSQINLSWALNGAGNNVIVAFNTTNTFGTPTDGTAYNAGDNLSGGGTILYKGTSTAYNHTSLNNGTRYYYKIWSVDGSNIYSGGATSQAVTTCVEKTVFPFTEGFSEAGTTPACWQVVDNQGNGQVWQFGTFANGLSGATGNYIYLNSDGYGDGSTQNTDIVTPTLDFSGYSNVTLAFSHYYRRYTTTDYATLSYSLNNGSSWTQIQQWTGTTANPASFNQVISAVANQSQVKFKWNYTGIWGYYWSIDNISITASASSSLTVDNSTHNVSANMAYQNVTVQGDGKLSVDAGKILTVTGDFIIQSDASGTGSFIQNGTLNVGGDITVQKYLPNTTTTGWTLSVPVLNADASVFSGSDGLYFYNSSTPGWQEITSGALQQMTGYVTRFSLTQTIEFDGTLNNGTYTRNDLVRTTSPVNYGWNYVGNPYPSPIDWDASPGISRTNINNAIYFRRSDGNMASYVNGSDTNGGTRYIPAMQAFWVQVTLGQTTGSLQITNDARVHQTNNIYKALLDDVLRLTINRNSFTDETIIRFMDLATNGFDGSYDAHKMFSSNDDYPQIYSLVANDELSINTLPSLTVNTVVPLGFTTENAGSHSITSAEVNTFDNNITILLEDLDENVITDLRLQNAYTFNTTSGQFNNRFVVHFNTLATETFNEMGPNDTKIYAYGNAVYITNIFGNSSDLTIYNMLGQPVLNQQLKSNILKKINTNLSAGTYLVKVTGNDRIISQKVYIK